MLSALSLLVSAGTARAAELRVTGDELAQMLQAAFQGTVVHLDADHSPRPGRLEPGSYLLFGPRLGGQRFRFSIPPKDVSLGFGAGVRYTVHDITSSPFIAIVTPEGPKPFGPNISVKSTSEAIVTTLRFEDAGTELVGTPVGRLGRIARGLLSDIQVDRMLLQIQLFPNASEGGLAFGPSVVVFSGDIHAEGVAGSAIGGGTIDLIDELTDYKKTIKTSVEKEIKRQVDAALPAISREVSSEIRRRAASVGARVSTIRFEGTDLVITGTPGLD